MRISKTERTQSLEIGVNLVMCCHCMIEEQKNQKSRKGVSWRYKTIETREQ
jgi:hypothetical protein